MIVFEIYFIAGLLAVLGYLPGIIKQSRVRIHRNDRMILVLCIVFMVLAIWPVAIIHDASVIVKKHFKS